MFGAPKEGLFEIEREELDDVKNPYVFVNLPDVETARQIQSRSVMIKSINEIFSEAESYEGLIKNMELERAMEYIGKNERFMFRVESSARKIKHKEMS